MEVIKEKKKIWTENLKKSWANPKIRKKRLKALRNVKSNNGWFKKGHIPDNKDKTYEELYGKDKAKKLKERVGQKKRNIPWNKNLTKETDKRVLRVSKKLKGNKNLIKNGIKLQKSFWADKEVLRAEVGMIGYKKVLKKYGKEHFLNLPLLVKYPNDYEIKIKNILMSHNINFQYQFRKNKCIPDFYSKGFWVLEATSLYPLRKDERVIQKIKQLQKYLNEFTEKLILVTLFTNEWVRTMEENNLNNRVEVCNDNKLMEIITK